MDCIFAEFNRLIVLLNRDVGSWERCGGTARGINSEKIPKILECIICILVPRWVKYLGCFQSYRRFRDDTRGLHIITIASESAIWNFFEKNNFILGHASFENLSWFSKSIQTFSLRSARRCREKTTGTKRLRTIKKQVWACSFILVQEPA